MVFQYKFDQSEELKLYFFFVVPLSVTSKTMKNDEERYFLINSFEMHDATTLEISLP